MPAHLRAPACFEEGKKMRRGNGIRKKTGRFTAVVVAAGSDLVKRVGKAEIGGVELLHTAVGIAQEGVFVYAHTIDDLRVG